MKNECRVLNWYVKGVPFGISILNIKPVSNGSHENSLDVCSGQRDSVHVISLELALFTNK